MSKRAVVLIVSAAALLALIIFGVVLSRQRVRRHRVFRPGAGEVRPQPPVGIPGVERWTEAFQSLESEELDDLLDEIEQRHPDQYRKWWLGYLHARALIEEGEEREAAQRLAPFLAEGHPLRDLAIYHQGEIADADDDAAAASKARQTLIFGFRHSPYRDQAIDEEADHLASNPQALMAFASRVQGSADTTRRRDLESRIAEALARGGDPNGALQRGLAILRGGTTDDASDRASRAIDRPELINRLNVDQLVLLGESMRNHRHFDRAVALLSRALNAKPNDELRFALGRCYFGDEKYAEAQQTYIAGANTTKDPKAKATFFFHASRAAQLQGNDAAAEQFMTAAIAVPGRFPATTAALTQRIRTRLKANRVAEAASDLALLRKIAPNDRAIYEGSLAYAVAMIARKQNGSALSVLNSVPPALMDKYDRAEVAYWRGRAQEASNPQAAFAAYLTALRADVPSHFAYFARDRLDEPAMAAKLAQELSRRDAEIARLVAAKQFDAAKEVATDRVLLSSKDRAKAVQTLASIYQQLPRYRDLMALAPTAMPQFPQPDNASRADLLMAMGLYDETTDAIASRWGLRPMSAALTRSLAMNRGGASRESIYAVEVMMNAAPRDYHPDLLPRVVRELLFPRYFYDAIAGDAKRFGADPTLVLSIMREESRFNPRAKSEAAARGLLQFIITTARDIGRGIGLVDLAPEDLYDPRVIIQLGAKYVAELSKQFDGNRYRAAASYNAGPKQVALWSRLAPAAGDDYFLSSINFDETKHYVRKVMNSYRRYSELYGDGAPAGGLRAEP